VRKKYWLLPIILVLLLLGGLVVVSQQSALASLIYTVFWAAERPRGRGAGRRHARPVATVCSGL